MRSFEKLGAFYLGRSFDPESAAAGAAPLLYDSRDLTTHGLIVGMTGSGKTGLSIVLLEEAALDGIPAIVIDPKGDMANLALRFPGLSPEDFLPWIEPREAVSRGQTQGELAAETARAWEEGITKWGQSKERIQALADAAEVAVYTPGSFSVRPLAVLRSFDAPSSSVVADEDALRERIGNAVSGLLGLVGIEADPLTSREHVLLSTILEGAWRASENASLEGLVKAIQSPPFEKLGALDLESFYSSKERMTFAARLNGLLASPAFAAWREGEPIDVQRLLYTKEGRPRIAVLSIAHLDDEERMFFVTLFLNEVITWMRAQEGTGSLRALLYMDEIFGFFPPVKTPPSKAPMLTLLKQARAFGLGVVLATQNPVDLDYKGLANIGTWFLGRLQTERDRERLMEGLATAPGGFDRKKTKEILSSLEKRVFLMQNVHEDGPVLFQTRWALSYLRGPMTLEQLRKLGAPPIEPARSAPEPETAPAAAASGPRPSLPPSIEEYFLGSQGEVYRPRLLATAELHFVSAAEGVDHWEKVHWLTPLEG
ncbi:MAG: ATP-binding protein, partial [Vicinamibacteria bacterium]